MTDGEIWQDPHTGEWHFVDRQLLVRGPFETREAAEKEMSK